MTKIALAQMSVIPGRKRENLARASQMVRDAATQGAQLVLLPEAMNLGWTDSSAKTEADEIPGGDSFQQLAQLAQTHKIWLCAGLVERHSTRIYNSAILLSPEGDLLLRHRKINELDFARELYACGSSIAVVDTPFAKIGVMICADAFVKDQVISRALCQMGAELILSPCAWAVPENHDNEKDPYGQLWLDNYCPVAQEFRVTIAGVSNVGPITDGPWAGRKCIGCSLVIGSSGEILTRGTYGERAEQLLTFSFERPRSAI